MYDKELLSRNIKHYLKVSKVLFIISICLFAAATLTLVGLIIMFAIEKDFIFFPEIGDGISFRDILRDFFSLFVSGGVVCVLFSTLIFRRRANFFKMILEHPENFNSPYQTRSANDNVKTVDVKDAPIEKKKGPYDDLIEEYRKLYEQGLITKEEFETKKKELTR